MESILKLADKRKPLYTKYAMSNYPNRPMHEEAYKDQLQKDIADSSKNPQFNLFIQLQLDAKPPGPLKVLDSNFTDIVEISENTSEITKLKDLDEAIYRNRPERVNELVRELTNLYKSRVVMPLEFLQFAKLDMFHNTSSTQSFNLNAAVRSPAHIEHNIQTFLGLVFASNRINYRNTSYRVATYEWNKSRFAPFGYRIEKKVSPPHLCTVQQLPKNFETILNKFADVASSTITSFKVGEYEKVIEATFTDYAVKQKGGGWCVGEEVVDALLEMVRNAKPTIHDFTLGSIGVIVQLMKDVRAVFTDVNPFKQLPVAISWYLGNISYDTHTSHKIPKIDAASRCTDFIYEYLAYRFSIYHTFFNNKKTNAFADLPFLAWTKKNSDIIKSLIAQEYSPVLSTPLRNLLKEWTTYDRAFMLKTTRLQHLDTMALLWICKSNLTCLLNEAVGVINSKILTYLITKRDKCNKDTNFKCIESVHKLLEGINVNVNTSTLQFRLIQPCKDCKQIPECKIETPFLKYVMEKGVQFNGMKISNTKITPNCEMEAVDATSDMAVKERLYEKAMLTSKSVTLTSPPEDYIETYYTSTSPESDDVGLAEKAVDIIRKDPNNVTYVSLMHTTPCDEFLHDLMMAKTQLYTARCESLHMLWNASVYKLQAFKTDSDSKITGAARNVLENKEAPFQGFEYEFKWKDEMNLKFCNPKPPTFDVSFNPLNKLHATYAAYVTKLGAAIKKLCGQVASLKELEGLNKIQCIQTAVKHIQGVCDLPFSVLEIPDVFSETHSEIAEGYMKLAREIVAGKHVVVEDPPSMLKVLNNESNAEIIANMIGENEVDLSKINLHAPILLKSNQLWDVMKNRNTMSKTYGFVSFVYAANEMYTSSQYSILKHDYVRAVKELQLILYFNIYQYNWNKFKIEGDVKVQQSHLEVFYEDSDDEARKELNELLSEQKIPWPINFFEMSRDQLLAYGKIFQSFCESRRRWIYLQLYNLLHTLGNPEEAHRYEVLFKQPVSNWPYSRAYNQAVHNSIAGKSVFDAYDYSTSNDWVFNAIQQKLSEYEADDPVTVYEIRLQYGIDRKQPPESFDWVHCLNKLGPDHALSKIVQHVHNARFPTDTSLDRAEEMVAHYITNPDFTFDKEDKETLSDIVLKELETFKTYSNNLDLAMKELEKAPIIKESGWPPENGWMASRLITDFPYIDGDYTISAIATVNILSQGSQLLIDEEKYKTTGIGCPDRMKANSRLRNLLAAKEDAPFPARTTTQWRTSSNY